MQLFKWTIPYALPWVSVFSVCVNMQNWKKVLMNVCSGIFNPTFSLLKMSALTSKHPCAPLHSGSPWPLGGSVTLFRFRFLLSAYFVSVFLCVWGTKGCAVKKLNLPTTEDIGVWLWQTWSTARPAEVFSLSHQTRPVYVLAEGIMAPCLCLQTRVPTSSLWLESVPQACPPLLCVNLPRIWIGQNRPRERERWQPPVWYCFLVLYCTVAIQIIGYCAKHGIVSQVGPIWGKKF